MGNFRKPCIECGRISYGTRCEDCEAKHNTARNAARDSDPRRIARKKEYYDSNYRRQAKWIRQTATTCHLCGVPFQPGDSIEADHVEPGNKNSQLLPAHRLCNQRKGNKVTPSTPIPPTS